MNAFGSRLRACRLQTIDPQTRKPITQQMMGELLRVEFGVRFSGTAVSDWERGKSKIHADDRLLLVSLVRILHKYSGIQSAEDANKLLEAGNYRALDLGEIQRTFPDAIPNTPDLDKASPLVSQQMNGVYWGTSGISKAWNDILDKSKPGPSPAWPRVITALVTSIYDKAPRNSGLRALAWIWIWLFSCFSVAPSLHWPLSAEQVALRIVDLYIAGTLVLPIAIGLLTTTKDEEYWMEKRLANSPILRLYTHQGAFVGFHVGYFIVVGIIMVRVFLRLPPAIWFEWMLMLVPIVISYMAAREVPYSLWRAYERLSLRDGGIFFVFILVGPFWGFFIAHYSTLLTTQAGILLVLMSITLLVSGTAWRVRKNSARL